MPYVLYTEQLEAQKVWRNKKLHSLKIKLGGKCVNCGDSNIDELVFDHIDPSTKVLQISRLVTYNKQTLENELQKCQLLCVPCHKIKTRIEKSTSQHGQGAMYNRCGPPKCERCRKYGREKTARNRIKPTTS